MPNELNRYPVWGSLPREMVPLRSMMDRLLEHAMMPASLASGAMGTQDSGLAGFGMDVDEDDASYYVSCHLPGVKPEDVNITFQDGVLTISGETRRQTREGRRPLHQEVSYGRFQRQISLPGAIDPAKAEAQYHDGILEVTLPKSEASRPRTIQVRSGGQSQNKGGGREVPIEHDNKSQTKQ